MPGITGECRATLPKAGASAPLPGNKSTTRRTNVLTLFVCNLHSKVTESTFEHFLQQGGLRYARLRMPDPAPGFDSNNRGYVFISFETREDYDAAQRYLEGRELAGKLLRTSKAHDRPPRPVKYDAMRSTRSEEHTSELQSQSNLVCRLLLEKKKQKMILYH